MTNFFCIRYRPHAPRGARGKGLRLFTVWRTNVLIRSYLQLSLAEAFLGVIFVSNHLRVAHYLLIRCYYSRITPTFPDGVTASVSDKERMYLTCFDVQKNCGVPDEEYAARFQTVLFMKLNIISNYFRGSF